MPSQSYAQVCALVLREMSVELQAHPISRSSCINASSTNASKAVLCSLN